MSSDSFKTPILFLIFNRPETTARVFESIRKIRPARLFIAADGPRANFLEDSEKCRQTRKIVANIDWQCAVETLYRENNLGCKTAISSAISWFFRNVESGIILEDDCLPNISFFTFCDELLQIYKNDSTVMHIGGNNFQNGIKRGSADYYFSNYNHIWGWASWRRAWAKYDLSMETLPAFVANDKISGITAKKNEQIYWLKMFERVRNNEIDTWDYQWTYAIWNAGGMSICPRVNLVSNIGFNTEATHTNKTKDRKIAGAPAIEMQFPLISPQNKKVDTSADLHTFKKIFTKKTTFPNKVSGKIKGILKFVIR